MTAPAQPHMNLVYKLIGATNALNELRERLSQAGLDSDYMQLIDAYRGEIYEQEQQAAAPLWGYIAATLPTVTDEPVAAYRVAYIAEAPATRAA